MSCRPCPPGACLRCRRAPPPPRSRTAPATPGHWACWRLRSSRGGRCWGRRSGRTRTWWRPCWGEGAASVKTRVWLVRAGQQGDGGCAAMRRPWYAAPGLAATAHPRALRQLCCPIFALRPCSYTQLPHEADLTLLAVSLEAALPGTPGAAAAAASLIADLLRRGPGARKPLRTVGGRGPRALPAHRHQAPARLHAASPALRHPLSGLA